MPTKLDLIARRALLSSALGTDDFAPASALVRVGLAARSHPGALKSNEHHYLVLRLGRYEETLFTGLASADVPRRFDRLGPELVPILHTQHSSFAGGAQEPQGVAKLFARLRERAGDTL